MEIRHESIVNGAILSHFKNIMGVSLMNNAANTCSIEQHLSVASVLWPQVIETDDYIFISEFYNGADSLENLKLRFNNDRKLIEQWVNSWSIGDFFLMSYDESLENEAIIMEFAKVLQTFWRIRFKELFPERKFCIELGNGLQGENDLTIVVYQE